VQARGARVVTPEAVVLDVRTAGLGSRVLARALDGLIQGAALVVVFTVTGVVLSSSNGSLGTAALVVDLVLITVIVFAYPIIWESLWRGRTPGKAALGLRVLTRPGGPIRFRHALVRGLVGLGEVMALPVVGVVAMLVSSNDQRLGDLAAGTIVVRERAAVRMSVPIVFYPPPGWEHYVASLDVSDMTPGEYETVRSFLIRAREMAPVPRSNLANRLAGPLVSRWHQQGPAGAGSELWLACVAAAYQRLHGAPAAQWGPPVPGPAYPGPAPAPQWPGQPGQGPQPGQWPGPAPQWPGQPGQPAPVPQWPASSRQPAPVPGQWPAPSGQPARVPQWPASSGQWLGAPASPPPQWSAPPVPPASALQWPPPPPDWPQWPAPSTPPPPPPSTPPSGEPPPPPPPTPLQPVPTTPPRTRSDGGFAPPD
jgi:uncharacterized RDD family membrane protein YckC